MKALSEDECRQWLAARRIPEQPYNSDEPWEEAEYQQVKFPENLYKRRFGIRSVVAACEPFEGALLQLTNWDDQLAIVTAVRGFLGETRRLMDTPGHLFAPEERDMLIEMTTLVVNANWSAYLYFSHRTAIYWWEGEMFDVFSPVEKVFRSIERAVAEMELLGVESEFLH